MILGLFRKRPTSPTAVEAAYARIVSQARQPALYRDFEAPDTLPGRFELIALHAILYFHRLKNEESATRAVGQEVFDLMFHDLDASLREIGVGDLTVPKRIKAMGAAFYDGVQAYDAALALADDDDLVRALAKNVYGDAASEKDGPRALAAYVRRAVAALAAQDRSDLVAVGPNFPPVKEGAS
jgi:cytochrome b pre-mRNA-processing protein 3